MSELTPPGPGCWAMAPRRSPGGQWDPGWRELGEDEIRERDAAKEQVFTRTERELFVRYGRDLMWKVEPGKLTLQGVATVMPLRFSGGHQNQMP